MLLFLFQNMAVVRIKSLFSLAIQNKKTFKGNIIVNWNALQF